MILRTFSKAYGLAGLRVGYALASDAALARTIAAAKTPFNVNGAAQIAALARWPIRTGCAPPSPSWK